jgi:hypothetical protein
LILKRTARVVLRSIKAFLAEEPAVVEDNYNYGDPPFTYEDANRFFKKIFKDGDLQRPHYVWGALQGVNLAKALGFSKLSFIEFGVAGGNGLLELEKIAEKLEPVFDVDIQIHGFDAASGLPKAKDHRDLPNLWQEGFYPMNRERLEQRLKRTKLHLGMVEETVEAFIMSKPAPVAFISFDLDYFSSTLHAFQLLEADQSILLPRIHCYFDDIMGVTFSDFNGERLAITEFNNRSGNRKISPIYGLRYFLPPSYRASMWAEMMYMAHIFDHNLYPRYDGLVRQTTLDLRTEPA